MMLPNTCVYVGPSDSGVALPITWTKEPPIRAGDLDLLDSTIKTVFIVDGLFGSQIALTVTEIRNAINRGVTIYGGVSLGALRAAECHPLGMRGIGCIAQSVADGSITEDADLSIAMKPDGISTTIPYVNIRFLCYLLYQRGFRSNILRSFLAKTRKVHFSIRDSTIVRQIAAELFSDIEPLTISELFTPAGMNEWDLKRIDYSWCVNSLSTGDPTCVPYTSPIPTTYSALLNDTDLLLIPMKAHPEQNELLKSDTQD